jgi:hypothetical protein
MIQYKKELLEGLQLVTKPDVIDVVFFRENIELCNVLIQGLHGFCEALHKDDKHFLGVLFEYCVAVLKNTSNHPNECVRSKNVKSLMDQYFTVVKGSMGEIDRLKMATNTLVMNINMLPKGEDI